MYSYICVVRYIYLSFLMEPLLCSETGALQSQKTFVVAYSIRGNDSSMTIHLKTTTKTNK